jgi:hypothetical protein
MAVGSKNIFDGDYIGPQIKQASYSCNAIGQRGQRRQSQVRKQAARQRGQLSRRDPMSGRDGSGIGGHEF